MMHSISLLHSCVNRVFERREPPAHHKASADLGNACLCMTTMQNCSMGEPSWDDFRFFLEIHRAGTLSLAGRRMRVNQTTVGRRLAALEHDLGTRLFRRESTRYVLTPSGRRLLEHVESIEERV